MLPSILSLGLALCGAVPPAQFEGGFPVTRRDQIFPYTDLKRGDRGIGYTVFAEDVVRPFDVEILGVMRGMLGPGQDVVLARLTGPEIEQTGVIAGMSGSPVYIEGKLLGAVAYRFGSFTKEAIAGITPIGSMLAVDGPTVDPRSSVAAGSGPRRGVGGISIMDLRTRDQAPPPGPALISSLRGDARPIETPLFVSGLDPEDLAAFSARLAGTGLVPVAGGGGGLSRAPNSGPRSVEPNLAGMAGAVRAAPIAPASPIAALLMRGDVDIAAIGTVTMVERGRVYAFGHPFLGGGHVDLPMATASILNTLASDAGSYKQGAPAKEVGVIRHDRLTAIAGELGQAAQMVPVHVHLHRVGQNAELLTVDVEIIDSPDWLPTMLEMIVGSVAARRLGFEQGGTVDWVARLQVGDRTLEIKDSFAAPAPLRVSAFAARDVANVAGIIAANELVPARIDAIDVKLSVDNEPLVATLLQVVPDQRQVQAGTALGLRARLRPYRGPEREIHFTLPIPIDFEGPLHLEIGGSVELDRRDAEVYGERFPTNLDELLGLLADRRPGRGLYGRSYPARNGLRVDAELYPSLPPSQRAALLSRPSSTQKALTESLGPAVSVPLPEVVFGNVGLDVLVYR